MTIITSSYTRSGVVKRGIRLLPSNVCAMPSKELARKALQRGNESEPALETWLRVRFGQINIIKGVQFWIDSRYAT